MAPAGVVLSPLHFIILPPIDTRARAPLASASSPGEDDGRVRG